MSHRSKPGQSQKYSLQRQIGLFVVYFIVLILIAGLLELITFGLFNPVRLTVLSIIGAVIMTILHTRQGRRSQVDDIVDF
jgi:TRAP-type C4-dicarboxylate transport system permease large subunit